MAILYPSVPHIYTASAAERTFIHALLEHLGDDWTVFHSLHWLDASRRRFSEGECDFVLLHPRYGWLVVEAKTGVVGPDSGSGGWRCDNGTVIKDPVKQAQRGMHHLASLLSDRLDFCRKNNAPPYGCAVALPHTHILPANMPPHAPRDIFILQNDLPSLEKRIVGIMSRFGAGDLSSGQSLTAEQFSAIVDVLLPQFLIVPSLSGQLNGERTVMNRLTEQQAFFLQCCRLAPNLLVLGPSGSGKTMLALEEARRFAAEGADVLFLCFNRRLMQYARSLLDKCTFAGSVTAINFHSLCREVIEAAGMRFDVPGGEEAKSRFFESDAATHFLTALPAYGRRFNVVLVDEAQDFREDWWLCVFELFKENANSHLHLFGDPRQALYREAGQLPFNEPSVTLPLNCRNTRRIADWIRERTDFALSVNSWCPEGESPQVISVADDRNEREAVRKTLHQLLYKEKLPAESIVVLGPRSLRHSPFAESRHAGPYQIVEFGSEPPAGVKSDTGGGIAVHYSTIHSFKGLEADVVLLTGVGVSPAHGEDSNMMLYVGASRARFRLFVYERPTESCAAILDTSVEDTGSK